MALTSALLVLFRRQFNVVAIGKSFRYYRKAMIKANVSMSADNHFYHQYFPSLPCHLALFHGLPFFSSLTCHFMFLFRHGLTDILMNHRH